LRLDENTLLLTLISLIDVNYSVPTNECVKLTVQTVLILENKSRPTSELKKKKTYRRSNTRTYYLI